MKTGRIFLVNVFVILLFATGAYAGWPFWSVYVGNNWNYSGSGGGNTWQKYIGITGTATVSGMPTYVEYEYRYNCSNNCSTTEKYNWYSASPTALSVCQRQQWVWITPYVADNFTLTGDSCLPWAKSTMTLGETWGATTSISGTLVDNSKNLTCRISGITLTVTVAQISTINLPGLGKYKAYQLHHVLGFPSSLVRGIRFPPYRTIPTIGSFHILELLNRRIITSQKLPF
jgi:hypothetical protein